MTEVKPPRAPKPSAPGMAPTPTPAAATDERHGRGGMYTVVNGQRVLVERTLADSQPLAADTTQPTETTTTTE